METSLSVPRFGLVGIGDAGRHHGRALSRLQGLGTAKFVAVVARSESALNNFASSREIQLPQDLRVFAHLDQMLEARCCDALVIATPDALHFEQTKLALGAGLHVLVEKPLSSTFAQATELQQLALIRQRLLWTGFQFRHHPAHKLVQSRLSEIGTMRTLSLRWAWNDPAVDGWRASGKLAEFWSLSALGVHCIDLVHYFSGATSVECLALMDPPAPAMDTRAALSLRTANNVLAHVSVAVTHRTQSLILLTGDLGEFELRGTLAAQGAGTLLFRSPRGEISEISFAPENPYLCQLQGFAESFAKKPANFVSDIAVDAVLAMIRAQRSDPGHRQ